MSRIFFISIGIMNIVLGILIVKIPAFYSSYLHRYIDLTKIRWPFGGTIFVLGCLFIGASLRKGAIEYEKRRRENERVYMCPKCSRPFVKKDVPTLKCPDCGSALENLSGFYERHPELKDKEINRTKGQRLNRK